MTGPHLSDQDLDVLADLPAGDPRREHAESCAKCRARWLDYQSFVRDEELPAEAGVEEARAALRAVIRREFATRSGAPPRRVAFPGLPLASASRWLAAAAAVIVVAAAGWWLAAREPGRVLRGSSGGSAAPLALLAADWSEDSVAVLRWRSHPRADAYEIRLYGADLDERARIAARGDTLLRVRPTEIPPTLWAEGELAWRVVALRGGAEVGRSALGTLRVP